MINKKSIQNDGYAYNDDEMTISLQLKKGIVDCNIDVILSVGEQDYIVLHPLNDFGDEEGEVWYYRYFDDEDDIDSDPCIEVIDSEEELNLIIKKYEEFVKRCDEEDNEISDVEPSITDEDLNNMRHSAGKLLNDMEELDDTDTE